MRRISISVKAAGFIFPLVLIISAIFTIDVRAFSISQQSCEADDCACEGFTPEQVYQQYWDRELAPALIQKKAAAAAVFLF